MSRNRKTLPPLSLPAEEDSEINPSTIPKLGKVSTAKTLPPLSLPAEEESEIRNSAIPKLSKVTRNAKSTVPK